jgi:tRNA 2-selenouridine synthase
MTKRADSVDYRSLFLSDVPMIDTRSPGEFARGAFPNSVNIPLMTNDERALVGTCYKQQGQDAAIKLGHELVSGAIKENRVQQWAEFARQHPEGYLYCFRGGLRSQISQRWLAEAGCEYPRITGGYKAMRRFLIETIKQVSQHEPIVVLAGQTGSAKTDILRGVPNSVDLEEIAHHRGSAFGKRVGGQPSQIDFENNLAVALLRSRAQHGKHVLALEDESMLIGRCALPDDLRFKMAEAPLVLVDASLEQRIEHSYVNYILRKLEEFTAAVGAEQGFVLFADDLRHSLKSISRRLGGERYQLLSDLLEQALTEQQNGDGSLHREWITYLLRDYYDPMYAYQLSKKQNRVVFKGDAQSVQQYLTQEVK